MPFEAHEPPVAADVLIVGAGAAGLRAAVEAARRGARTIVLSKGKLGRSGATFFRSSPVRGMQVATTPAELRGLIEDILLVGLGAADERLAEILAAESLPRWRDLTALGVPFARERAAGCFTTAPRAFVIENLDALAKAFEKELARLGVPVLERTMAIDVAPGAGARAITAAGDVLEIAAPAIVLATGGGAGAFKHSLTAPDQVGDALALAPEAGVTNLEFLQIMIGTFKPKYIDFYPVPLLAKRPAITRADGRAMDVPARAYELRTSHFPFSTRDDSKFVDLAVAKAAGSAPARIGEYEVAPFAHAHNGGLAIDADGATSIAGLFACGEAAGGMHGADRVGGAMMTATQVFGARAGAAAAKFSKRRAGTLEFEPIRTDRDGLGVGELRNIRTQLAELLQRTALTIRTRTELERAEGIVRVWRDLLDQKPARDRASQWAYFTARHAVCYAEALYRAMRSRTAALGPHFIS